MIIGIDIDDTITDTYEVMVNYAQEYTMNVLKREPVLVEDKICSNHFYTFSISGWKDGEDIEFLNEYYESIIENVRPKTLALKYLNKIKDENNKIILITSRFKSEKFDIEEKTREWITKNNIPYDKLIVNAENKLIAAKQENIDVFIDDSFENCKKIADYGIKTFMMDTRVNRGLESDNIKRVYSWPHLYMKLKEMGGKI